MSTNNRDSAPPATSGASAVVLATGAETGGLYSVVALTLPAHDRGAAPHIHPRHAESCLVVAGTLAITRADELLTLSQGEALLVAPGVRHACWNPTASPTTALLIYRPGLSEAEATALALGASGFT